VGVAGVSRRSRTRWRNVLLALAAIFTIDMVLMTLRLIGWLLVTAMLAGLAYYAGRLHERRAASARVSRSPAAQVSGLSWPRQPAPVTSSPGDRAAQMPRATRESLLADARSGAHDLRGLQ